MHQFSDILKLFFILIILIIKVKMLEAKIDLKIHNTLIFHFYIYLYEFWIIEFINLLKIKKVIHINYLLVYIKFM